MEVWGLKKKRPVHLKLAGGKRPLAKWNEHFQKLLNVPGGIDHELLDNIHDMARAVAGLKDGNTTGGDGIPAEVWKEARRRQSVQRTASSNH